MVKKSFLGRLFGKKGEVDKAVKALRAYEVGKPLVIEEMFPLKCSSDELAEFVTRSSDHADGWISFYWGATAEELLRKEEPTIGDAMTASWQVMFRKISQDIKPGK